MRERSYRVDRNKLSEINKVYRTSNIINRLNISRQVWHNYRSGKSDVPEGVVDRICNEFKINKDELALA